MKKEIIIVLVILIFITSLDILANKYTKEGIESLNVKLNELKEEILNKKQENINSKFDEIYLLWSEKEKVLSYYIEHDELEKVESKLNLIKGNIEVGLYEETIQDIDDVNFILKHIEEKYKLILKNIF